MGHFIDDVPLSGIIRIRDMMYGVKDPFRLDQGDVSFDAPDTVKRAMQRAIDENRSHYLQTTGVPRLLELLADKLRLKNHIPVASPDEIMVTTGGIHALFIMCQALLEPGDEVIVPDPEWPPAMGNIRLARGVPVPCPLHERLGWRWDLDELASKHHAEDARDLRQLAAQSDRRGADTAGSSRRIAALATRHDLWMISDEAYEDVIFDGAEHVSPASLPGMHERTISFYTFSKSYAMTGLRLGYVVVQDAALRDRMKKVLFYTASNVTSVVQYGGDRRARRIAGVHRRVSQRAAGAARSVLRGDQEARRRRAERRAAEGGVLRVSRDRPVMGAGRRTRRRRCRGRWPST